MSQLRQWLFTLACVILLNCYRGMTEDNVPGTWLQNAMARGFLRQLNVERVIYPQYQPAIMFAKRTPAFPFSGGIYGKRAPAVPFSGGIYGKRAPALPFSGGIYGKRSQPAVMDESMNHVNGLSIRAMPINGGFYG